MKKLLTFSALLLLVFFAMADRRGQLMNQRASATAGTNYDPNIWLKPEYGTYSNTFGTLVPSTQSNYVRRWDDFSGHNNHFTNCCATFTLEHSPVLVTNQLDGYPAMSFATNNTITNTTFNKYLSGPIPADLTNGARTYLIVARLIGPFFYPTLVSESQSSPTVMRVFANSPSLFETLYAGVTLTQWGTNTFSTSEYYMHGFVLSTNSAEYWQGRHRRFTAAHAWGAAPNKSIVLGNRGNFNENWNGLIAEVIIWDRALSQVEIETWYDYLKAKYPSLNNNP